MSQDCQEMMCVKVPSKPGSDRQSLTLRTISWSRSRPSRIKQGRAFGMTFGCLGRVRKNKESGQEDCPGFRQTLELDLWFGGDVYGNADYFCAGTEDIWYRSLPHIFTCKFFPYPPSHHTQLSCLSLSPSLWTTKPHAINILLKCIRKTPCSPCLSVTFVLPKVADVARTQQDIATTMMQVKCWLALPYSGDRFLPPGCLVSQAATVISVRFVTWAMYIPQY